MESMLELISILFILSLICERVAEFLKHYLSEFKIKNFQLSGNMSIKSAPNTEEEQIRHYRILKLNLFCGFLTALLCHASLFEILKHTKDLSTILGWPDNFRVRFCLECIPENVWFLTGCFLTGAFISLGSKFWHDLLDLLLAVKDAKRGLAQATGTLEFSDLSNTEQHQLLASAINDLKTSWRNNYKNYRGVSVANKLKGKNQDDTGILALRFSVKEKKNFTTLATNRIPTSIYFKGYKLPTDVVQTGVAKGIADDLVDPTKLPRPLGCGIGRMDTGYAGTLGALVSTGEGDSKKFFGLSCYHVLFPVELKNSIREIGSAKDQTIIDKTIILSPSQKDNNHQNNIGYVAQGMFNEFLDIGIFETTLTDVSAGIVQFGIPDSVYHVEESDKGTLKVKFCGRSSGVVEGGTVESIKTAQLINYFRKFDHEIQDLVQIRIKAIPGDSGAAVLTDDNKLIGILTASDDTFAYAIPVRFIENNFPYNFETKKFEL